MSYKHKRICAVYQGEESLEGKSVHILIESYSETEYTQKMEESNGNRGRFLEGNKIKKNEEIVLVNSGSGPDAWEYGENMHFIAWIYYDDECVEVIKQ